MIKTLKNFLSYALFFALILLAITLSFKREFSSLVFDGLNLWLTSVLPVLFPYFFITAVLSALSVTQKLSRVFSPVTKRVFNTGGAVGYAYFMSLISGYPVGAKIVCDLKENGVIGKAESVRAFALCSTSSLSFTVGVIGNIMFENSLFGLLVFSSVVISSIITGFIFSFYKRKEKPLESTPLLLKKTDNVLYESAYSSVISVLMVGALITVFYMLTELLLRLNILSPVIDFLTPLTGRVFAQSAILGLFECTRALKSLSLGGITLFTLPIASAICGFGGFSVIAQSLSYLKKAKIKTAPFLVSKILSAALNFLVSLILSLAFL